MPLPVVLTPEAREHLRELQRYIAQASSRERAGRYIARLTDAIAVLGEVPQMGTKRDDLRTGLRSTGFERRITILFTSTAQRVVVVAILYGGRQLDPFV